MIPEDDTTLSSLRPGDVRPELLAPAGDMDCARAAVANGADAIYFGLDRFNALVPKLPVIVGAAESRAAAKIETGATQSALTNEERAVCRAMGQSEADFLAAKKSEA